MMVLKTCTDCGIRFYAPLTAQQSVCWRCDRTTRTGEANDVAERLLAQVFPEGLPARGHG